MQNIKCTNDNHDNDIFSLSTLQLPLLIFNTGIVNGYCFRDLLKAGYFLY